MAKLLIHKINHTINLLAHPILHAVAILIALGSLVTRAIPLPHTVPVVAAQGGQGRQLPPLKRCWGPCPPKTEP